MVNIKSNELLEDAILRGFEDLNELNSGTEEYSTALESVVKLYKLMIEEKKIDLDHDEKCSRRKMEGDHFNRDVELKEKQLDTDANLKERQIDNDCANHDVDAQLKRDQLVEQMKDRYFKYGVEFSIAVLTLMFYGRYMRKGFKFEETGTIASSTFRNLISNFKMKLGR